MPTEVATAASVIDLKQVDFDKIRDVQEWLQAQQPELSSAFAVRAALRIVPAMAMPNGASRFSKYELQIALPIFRALAVPFAFVVSPDHLSELELQANLAAREARGIMRLGVPSDDLYAEARAIIRLAARAATAATTVMIHSNMSALFGRIANDYSQKYDPQNDVAVAVRDADIAASKIDAKSIEGGVSARALLASPLWPSVKPEWVEDNWRELRGGLLGAYEDWSVWTEWYDSVLSGSVSRQSEVMQLARATVPSEVWSKGARATNDWIKRASKTDVSSVAGASSSDESVAPPKDPLPSQSPATRFAVVGGRIDVLPSEAWHGQEIRVSQYHAQAMKLAASLAERLDKTDAVPQVAGSVIALMDVLEVGPQNLQPDQLRMASRAIAASARAYGHPSAQWEISAESVASLFELADVLVDLQSFARAEIDQNERAIRSLDLEDKDLAEAKGALDELSKVILSAPEITTEKVDITLKAAAEVSSTAEESAIRVAVEGERILLTENIALAIAREIGRSPEPNQPNTSPVSGHEVSDRPRAKRRRTKMPSSKAEDDGGTWAEFRERVVKRIHETAPEAIADAAVKAAADVIKHSPKTIPGLAAALLLWVSSYPILAGGSLALTTAWIGFELLRRKGQTEK
jgi:hypothetical protein